MDLDIIWISFIKNLEQETCIRSIQKKKFGGQPFVYLELTSPISKSQLENLLTQSSKKAMIGKRLTCDISFVRMQHQTFVYHIRFKVPQEKLFCCGNSCTNCIRLK
ncbi:hypothetical protein [Halalkalibacter okhensis]|uniref:Uncharacterized protein n=1 Tax=Halalkalibacter okhensis TaxID=333138 RepID=A0A0B0IL73_9BACI|nr:hypothetical protein [Halalkalibacter okhensis]KHF40804.1 hypothetical protein LQ50_06825 [Halalkalibacter okhensis]